MLRNVAILGAAIVVLQLASTGAQGVSVAETKAHRAHHGRIHAEPAHRAAGIPHVPPATAETFPWPASAAPISLPYQVPPATIEASPERAYQPPPALTYQEEKVSQMADGNGDRDFLMVDKALGKIILFENGSAIFGAAALTGASSADRLPPGSLAQKFSKQNAPDTKVTPAGRFTVKRGHDGNYGTLLDINEIRGKDWGIAIHKVYLGNPSEHRDARLQSPDDEDKHITFGCINVTRDTIQFLLRELPKTHATPLYILPQDQARTEAYFTPHSS